MQTTFEKNWSSLRGVMKECIKSPAGPSSPCIYSVISFPTHHAFHSIAFCSSLFNSAMERFFTSLFTRPSRASLYFYFKAPPSTIASPIQAFEFSASFCPLSSRALWMQFKRSKLRIHATSASLNLNVILLQPTPGPASVANCTSLFPVGKLSSAMYCWIFFYFV